MKYFLVILFKLLIFSLFFKERKSIYVFNVDIIDGGNTKNVPCFSPAQGKMGAIKDWNGVPCLLSKASSKKQERTTKYTVEAISIPDRPIQWIGINHLKYKECIVLFSFNTFFPNFLCHRRWIFLEE